MSVYKKSKTCSVCSEPYIVGVLNCKCGHDHDTSFRLRKKKDFVLELLLEDMRVNMGTQIEIERKELEETRQLKVELDTRLFNNSADRWSEYAMMNPETAKTRLRRMNERPIVDQLDDIAAEG